MFTKEEADRISQTKGQVRGTVFQTDAEYIKRKYGQEGLTKVKKQLEQLGYPIEYENVKALNWHPLSRRVISFLVMKDIFQWQDADFRKMGNEAPKYSFIVKLMIKFFISPRIAFSHAPDYWIKHYNVGILETTEFNEDNMNAVVRIKEFETHSIYCRYLEGYFQKLFQFMLPNKKVEIQETKCMLKGDAYHEFRVEWRD